MAQVFWFKGHQFFDDSGNPLNAGTINIYDATTTSTKTVYQDAAGGVAWSQPITLNSAGRLTASVYVGSGAWKFVAKTSGGATITTEDNIPGATAPLSTAFGRPLRPIITKAANYTVTTNDIGSLVVVDPTGGDVTLSLPDAVNVTSGTGIDVIHVGTANNVILDGSASQLVGSGTTYTITERGQSVGIASDGASSWALENAAYRAAQTLASATTTDLKTAAADYVIITGNVTITSFGTAPAGLIRRLLFTGTPLLTYNGTSLTLPTSANIQVVAGDIAQFRSGGSGNWSCFSFQRSDGAPLSAANTLTLIKTVDGSGSGLDADTIDGLEVSGYAATQAQMEAASSTALFASPGRQHFHPGHPKCWAYVTVSAGTPTLTASYNITSITDTGTGVLTITIATDFSSADWASSGGVAGNPLVWEFSSKAAGSVAMSAYNAATFSAADPTSWNFAGFGDQA